MAYDAHAEHEPDTSDRNSVAPPVIVVGLDGSPSSWDAFCWAAGEAARSNRRLVAVNVLASTDAVAALGVPYDYASVEQNRQQVADELRGEAARRAHELGVVFSSSLSTATRPAG